MFLNYEILDNVFSSDHSTIIMDTDAFLKQDSTNKQVENIYTTVIKEYETLKSPEEEWNKVCLQNNNTKWN